MIGLSVKILMRYSIIWSLSNGVLGFYNSYFFVYGVNRVSACHDKPILRWSLPPCVLLIASYTILRLSNIVSSGQMKVPSGEYFNAA